jgi:cyclophilin family peptidyl-prolyl cis-trans isomerase
MKTVTFETNKGTFTAELYADDAPGTVANFEKLVKDGFYDGIVFHRVIPDFVVQGGDPITKEHGLNHPRVGHGRAGLQDQVRDGGQSRAATRTARSPWPTRGRTPAAASSSSCSASRTRGTWTASTPSSAR